MKRPSVRDTGAAKLPGLPTPGPLDPALRAWVAAATERLEVREGSRGNPWERAVTVRDVDEEVRALTARLNALEAALNALLPK